MATRSIRTVSGKEGMTQSTLRFDSMVWFVGVNMYIYTERETSTMEPNYASDLFMTYSFVPLQASQTHTYTHFWLVYRIFALGRYTESTQLLPTQKCFTL